MKQLEEVNKQLKTLEAGLSLVKQMLQDVLKKFLKPVKHLRVENLIQHIV